MWTVIPSISPILQSLSIAFTEPSFQSHLQIFLGWMMCVGKRTEFTVFETIEGEMVSRKKRHPFDRFYNFFSRSSWTVMKLANAVALQIVVALNRSGTLFVIVDDTLLHKKGKHVYGLGWFRDAVASTAERVAVASGNHFVVMGFAIAIPRTDIILFFPLISGVHVVGKNSEPILAKEMFNELKEWFPNHELVLLGDGAYASKNLLGDWDHAATFIGVMRSDAEIYHPQPPRQPKSKPGRKPTKGARLPAPREAAKKTNHNRSGRGPWVWQTVEAMAYGVIKSFQVVSYQVVWPEVLGLKRVLVLVVHDPEGTGDDKYLFCTNVEADLSWVISAYARRWSIEVAFKASKQTLGIQDPQHWCQESIEKLAPWVWLMQSIVSLWYVTEGRQSPEAKEARRLMGPWDTEWSLRNILRVFRRATLRATISLHSGCKADLLELIRRLDSYLNLAA